MNKNTLAMFIPIAGRVIVDTDRIPVCNTLKEMNISGWFIFLENTLFYFLIGFTSMLVFNLTSSIQSILIIWIVVGPVEFLLIRRFPKQFLARARVSKFEFFWIAYQTFWFFALGSITGAILL